MSIYNGEPCTGNKAPSLELFWDAIGEHKQRKRDTGLSLPLIGKSTRWTDDEDGAHLMVEVGLFSLARDLQCQKTSVVSLHNNPLSKR